MKTSITKSTQTSIQAEYDGVQISFTGDAWFNATAASKKYGKSPHEWTRLSDTVRYVHALENRNGKIPFLKVVRGGRGRPDATWMHPKLAVRFAQWLDVDFAVWCDEQIDHILRGGLSLLSKNGSQRSDTPDREPLLTAAAAIVARHRLPFSTVYEALNTFAGVAHAREMSCDQVADASLFGSRLLNGTATAEDFALLERRRVEFGAAASQTSLLGGL